jgi:hydrogenase maturation protease
MNGKRKIVLGLGNLLYSDEGMGVHAIRAMEDDLAPRYPQVEFIDGGTLGLDLLSLIEESSHVLVIDCVNARQPEGTVIELSKEQIPLYAGVKMSLHQTTFQEVLVLAGMRQRLPENLHLIGVQPVNLEVGTALSPEVQAHLPEVVARTEAVLKGWTKA